MSIFSSSDRLLPASDLQKYLNRLLLKRETFLLSAARFGTPQYFFDEPSLEGNIIRFKEAFSRYLKKYRIFYAMKSNSFPGILKSVVSDGLGVDVSSGLELSRALAGGFNEIVFSGPGKRDEEIRAAVDNREKVTLLMDSFGELDRTTRILRGYVIGDVPLKAGIRLQHQNGWTKFGIPIEDLEDFFKKGSGVKGLELCGIQFHTSWNLAPAAQIEMIKRIGTYLRKVMPSYSSEALKFLDIGGGFWPEEGEWLNPENSTRGRIREILTRAGRSRRRHYYRKGNRIGFFANQIARAINEQGPPISNLEIWMEPGRWISNPSMHILLEVVDKKDQWTVITDGGTNLLGWERPLTEFIPVINLTNCSLEERPIRIFGSLCTPHDVWGHSVFGSHLEKGDILLIPDQGAYTYSLRQTFIKPVARVIRYDGKEIEEVKGEERVL